MQSARLNRRLQQKLEAMLRLAFKEARAINWTTSGYDRRKAACLALFAEIAYYKITEDEYHRPARAKIIPCASFRRAVASGTRLRFEDAVSLSDFDAFFVIQSRNFVALVAIIQGVTIVAIRGTQYLYDWKINFQIRKSDQETGEDFRFHAGFLREAQLLGFHVNDHVARTKGGSIVIVTGHSLGGAIAAVASAISFQHLHFSGCSFTNVKDCYSFASPRYAGFEVMLRNGSVYNTINDFDIVPRVPPTMLGYSNFIHELNVHGEPYTNYEMSATSKTRAWLTAVATENFLENHSMETYRRKIRM